MGEDDTPSPHVTACRRCRKQKLRCSRDVPNCKRCEDISALCEYPPPPDRKLLAAQRLASAKSRARQEPNSSSYTQRQQQKLPAESDGFHPPGSLKSHHATRIMGYSEPDAGHHPRRESAPDNHRALTCAPLQAALRRITLPSPEVADFLFNIYFSRLYNSNLLFHKQTFLSEYAANNVPDFVALSIFALASIFLGPSTGQSPQNTDEDEVDLGISMLSGSDNAKQGLEWATAASQRALMQADVPRLETIQACQNLALYWFSRGQTDKTYIHSHMAYTTARLLNLHVQHRVSGNSNASDLSDELERRCFWSCWITSCISQDNANFKSKPWQEVMGLTFPSDEESYCSGRPVATEFFDENGEITAVRSGNEMRVPSVMAELAKLFDIWWQIQNFVKQNKELRPADSPVRIATLLELDRRLGLVFENLHPDFQFQNAASFQTLKQDPYRLFSIHSLYRLCACALHTSIVPLFSETPSTLSVSKKLVRLSAEESVRHAAVVLDMATDFLSTRPDMSRLPSIAGYGMFVACTVHFKSLLAQKKLQSHGISRFKGAISILESLKEYWATNHGLWTILKKLFGDKGINIESISRTDSRPHPGTDEQQTDLERIVSHEATPQGGVSTDIYTYVASQEAKGLSPRRQSDTSTARRISSAQNTPSPAIIPPPNTTEKSNSVHEVKNDVDLRHFNPNTRTSILPNQQQVPSPPQIPTSQSPLPPGYQQAFSSIPPIMRPTMSNVFLSPGAVAHEYQMPGTSQLLEARLGVGLSIVGYGADANRFSVTEMEVDGVDSWWDQLYDATYEGDLGGLVDRVHGSGSRDYTPYEPYSFQ